MNKYQRNAIKYHCRFAFETQRPCLRRLAIDGATIISVNSGYE